MQCPGIISCLTNGKTHFLSLGGQSRDHTARPVDFLMGFRNSASSPPSLLPSAVFEQLKFQCPKQDLNVPNSLPWNMIFDDPHLWIFLLDFVSWFTSPLLKWEPSDFQLLLSERSVLVYIARGLEEFIIWRGFFLLLVSSLPTWLDTT